MWLTRRKKEPQYRKDYDYVPFVVRMRIFSFWMFPIWIIWVHIGKSLQAVWWGQILSRDSIIIWSKGLSYSPEENMQCEWHHSVVWRWLCALAVTRCLLLMNWMNIWRLIPSGSAALADLLFSLTQSLTLVNRVDSGPPDSVYHSQSIAGSDEFYPFFMKEKLSGTIVSHKILLITIKLLIVLTKQRLPFCLLSL